VSLIGGGGTTCIGGAEGVDGIEGMAGAGIAGAGIAGIGDEWGMVPLNCATVAPLDITTTAAAATTVLAILSMPVFPLGLNAE